MAKTTYGFLSNNNFVDTIDTRFMRKCVKRPLVLLWWWCPLCYKNTFYSLLGSCTKFAWGLLWEHPRSYKCCKVLPVLDIQSMHEYSVTRAHFVTYKNSVSRQYHDTGPLHGEIISSAVKLKDGSYWRNNARKQKQTKKFKQIPSSMPRNAPRHIEKSSIEHAKIVKTAGFSTVVNINPVTKH